ncbi:MAG: M28 family peptidase [Thermoguttaceae bacterium]
MLAGASGYRGKGRYPLPAYSEFMPPPRLGEKPYGGLEPPVFDPADPWGWHVTEYEEALELGPGLALLALEILHVLVHLGRGEPAHGIARGKLRGNPYWPQRLAEHGAPAGERYVLLLPLALSRTQDDRGRVRWTLFGTSERGPGRAFWRGFFRGPREELPRAWCEDFVRRLLAAAYDPAPHELGDLGRGGFRVFADDSAALLPAWREGPLPTWTDPYRWDRGQSLRRVRYLLSFCPFERLPRAVQRAYLDGGLHLLPFPGSLFFFGAPPYFRLRRELPTALHIPLLHSLQRHEAPWGIRIPQSGWLHEAVSQSGGLASPQPPHEDYGPLRNTFRRSHRWERMHRHEDMLAVAATEDKLTHVLMSPAAEDVGLYGKPMARNSQIWTDQFRLLLDGPRATPEDLARAAARLARGGLFGYRMTYPPMRVGHHEVYWHRPLAACLDSRTGEPAVLADAPLGSLVACGDRDHRLARGVELWPRLLARRPHMEAIRLFTANHEQHYRQTMLNVRKLLCAWELRGGRPLPRGLARQLLTLPKGESLEAWLASLPGRTHDPNAAEQLTGELRRLIEAGAVPSPPTTLPAGIHPGLWPTDLRTLDTIHTLRALPASVTLARTARRSFETAYWKTIALLATGRYRNKDNADCVTDPQTQARLAHHHRDLEALGDFLLARHRRAVAAAGMARRAVVGELPFHWRTDFPFAWSGGWQANQQGRTHERDLVVVIPGRDRRRAVIMADHYDTAYMEDVFGYPASHDGPRLAAAGADDNHSATAALLLAAPIFLDLARQGRLRCDIWLVHLTGEEFPADCMGARHLCQQLVEGGLRIRLAGGRWKDLSRTRVDGVYVMDMIAHNSDRDRDVFQISPGSGGKSLWLAEQAQAANELWNASTAVWNRTPGRLGRPRGIRSADGWSLPAIAPHLPLYGEVRPQSDPRSSLYNTDGQIFSDAGVPVVLFMENYDIQRHGYHDSQDTMAMIDLDYGSALAAIAIESVARAAIEPPPG